MLCQIRDKITEDHPCDWCHQIKAYTCEDDMPDGMYIMVLEELSELSIVCRVNTLDDGTRIVTIREQKEAVGIQFLILPTLVDFKFIAIPDVVPVSPSFFDPSRIEIKTEVNENGTEEGSL